MTTYSISLDDLDLALLPVRSQQYNDFLKKEYYEFKLMTGETKTEEDPPIIEQYRCHLCAIDVPTTFSNAHCAGAKHQANVSIAMVASQRMRDLATAKPLAAAPQTTERFCDPCATIASEDHAKTKDHRVAVIHDRMLCELSKLYVDEDDSDDKLENKDVKRDDITVAKDIPPKPKAVINAKNQTQKVIEDIKANEEAGPEDNKITKLMNISMEMYIKLLKSVPIFPKVAVKAKCGKVQITVDNVQMLVSADCFHSFYREETQLTCNLCMRLLKPGEEEIHKLSMVHVESIIHVVDGHCIRQANENWSHCILCNVIVKNTNVNGHKVMKKHLENRERAIVSKKLQIQLTDLEKAEVKLHKDSNFKFQENKLQGKDNGPLRKDVSNSAGTASCKIDIPKIDPAQVILAPYQSIPQKMVVRNETDDKNTEADTREATVKNVSGYVVDTLKTAMHPVQIRTEIMPVLLDKNRIDYPFEPIDQGSVRCTICCCVVPRCLENRMGHLNGQRHANSVQKQFPPL